MVWYSVFEIKSLSFLFSAAFNVEVWHSIFLFFYSMILVTVLRYYNLSMNCAILHFHFFFYASEQREKVPLDACLAPFDMTSKEYFLLFCVLCHQCSFFWRVWKQKTERRENCERYKGREKKEQAAVSDWGVWSRSCCGIITGAMDSHCWWVVL